jgi:hypothetical protein
VSNTIGVDSSNSGDGQAIRQALLLKTI